MKNWDALAEGRDCPFDRPRAEPNDYWDPAARLDVSTLCLLKNQAYRGACILIYDVKHVISPDQLSEEEWSQFSGDLHRAVRALKSVCRPDHVNVASLGHEVPHLHWHVIPRYKTDPRWGGPIWTTTREELHHAELPEKERTELVVKLRDFLTNEETWNAGQGRGNGHPV